MLEELREKQEHDEHALWQPGGFHSTLKILVISASQTLGLYRPDMKFQFCHVVPLHLVCHIHDMACMPLYLSCKLQFLLMF